MPDGPGAGPMKIFMNPGMIVFQELGHGADFDPLVDEDGDTVADRTQAVQIVRNHEHG
jgi:hypothetical protein